MEIINYLKAEGIPNDWPQEPPLPVRPPGFEEAYVKFGMAEELTEEEYTLLAQELLRLRSPHLSHSFQFTVCRNIV